MCWQGSEWLVFVFQDAMCGTIKIFILSASHAPEKGPETERAQAYGNGYQKQQGIHLPYPLAQVPGNNRKRGEFCCAGRSGLAVRGTLIPYSLRLLATTMMDEEDMATAAMNGLT